MKIGTHKYISETQINYFKSCNPITENFKDDIEKLVKESINGNGFICCKGSVGELLDMLIGNYSKEFNNLYDKQE